MPRGGYRPGAGRKPNPNKPKLIAAPKLRPQIMPAATVPAEPKSNTLDYSALAQMLPEIERISRQYAVKKSQQARKYEFPKFPDAAMPPEETRMALDSELKSVISYGNSVLQANGFDAVAGEGLLFLGYTYLAELAQRPEYRVIAETIADDSTRKWIDFDVTGDPKQEAEEQAKDPAGFAERMADPDQMQKRVKEAGKLDKVKALKDDQLRLEVQQAFYQASRTDNFFGRAHLFLDIRTNGQNTEPSPDDTEIQTDIGDATPTNAASKTKVTVGSFKAIRLVEPMWAYPILYNATDPLRSDWYNPQQWYVMGKNIHQSRLLTFVGHPVPDILKPAYAFGGLSLSQMVKPYVDIWLDTRQSVAEMIKAYSVMVLGTDLSQMMQPNGQSALLARIALFNMLRDNQGLFVHNKETEEFKNVSATISGLDKLQAQAQEHMSSVARIPLVKLTGISPSGLNATSEFELEVYDDSIEAYQERFHMPKLQKVVNFQMLSLWGEIDPEITIRANPLRQVSEAEKGEQQAKKADMHEKFVNMGAIAPAEVRRAIVEDEDMPYADLGLDPEDLPEPPAEEGLLSGKGGKGGEGEQGQGGFGSSEGGEEDEGQAGDYGAGDEALDDDPVWRIARDAAEWKESDHKRDDGGKFTSGGGGGGGAAPSGGYHTAQAPQTNIGAPLSLKGLQRVGKQMGSNPGGVFQSADGKQFYVKQGKTPAHVKNELIAGALYNLAGTPTLKYRPVEGGGHIATEMAKLDKSRTSQFDEKQRQEAKKDFAVHAWLANWDAAGTGGDNLGIVKGKPTALDVGGALEFRAQGAPKGKAFGDKVTELATMRDKNMSPDNAKLFGDMTPAELRQSASYVTSIPDADIKRTVEKLGGSPELAQRLIARKNDIAKQAEQFGHDADPTSPESAVVFGKDGKLPAKELNGIPFTPWEAPESNRDWAEVDGQADIPEPEFIVPQNKRAGTGVIIREPDGRVWLMRPKNGFGGYQHTFPKGGLERGLPPQANAIKEAYEETGLKAKITGFAGDHEGDTSFTRYYFAEREAGDPSKTTWESDGVVLAPVSKLKGFLNRARDRKIVDSFGQAHDEAPFDESKHPRGPDGKFTDGAGGGGGGGAAPDKDGKAELKKEAPYGGLYVTAHGEDKAANHKATVEKYMAAPTQIGIHYRRMLAQLLKEGPGFGTGKVALGIIRDKLADSWLESAQKLEKAGKQAEADKAYAKAKAYGWGGEQASPAPAAKPAPAPAAEPPAAKPGWEPEPEPKKPEPKVLTTFKGEFGTTAEIYANSDGKNFNVKLSDEPDKFYVVSTYQAAEAKAKAELGIAAEPPKPSFPKPTEAELAKAKKSVALQPQYVPGDKPEVTGGPEHGAAMTLIQKFNELYAGKNLTDPAALEKKVNDFKTLTAGINALAKAEQQNKATAIAKAQEAHKAAAAEKAAKAEAEAKKHAEQNKQIMADLGLNEQHAEGFHALAEMLGANPKTLAQNFKKYEDQAKAHGYPITGFQCALIKNYSNGGYTSVNDALRSGSWTPAQHVYASMVNQALLGMPRHKGKLYRNVQFSAEQIAKYKEGHVFQEDAFMSTSTNGAFGKGRNVQFVITSIGKRGADIKKLSHHPGENEVLFAAKTYFKVNKIEPGNGGKTTIHIEEWDAPL